MKTKASNRVTGKKGERLAESYLRTQGYKIISRNVRSPFGEIDLIAKHKKMLVFIEVKARQNRDFGLPEESITEEKKRRLARLANWYLAGLNQDVQTRFDVLAIELTEPEPKIRLIQNAFDVPTWH